jgi:hypothetical protein
MTAPHALMMLAIAVANCGAASCNARNTTFVGFAAASTPMIAMTTPTTA